MKRSIRNSCLSLSGAALLAVVGCSHNEPAAKQPSSAPFESNVPSYDTNQPQDREARPRPNSDGTLGSMYGSHQGEQNNMGQPGSSAAQGLGSQQGMGSHQSGSSSVGQGVPSESSRTYGSQGQTGGGSLGQDAQGQSGNSIGQGMQGQSGSSGPGASATQTMSERDLCDSLTREAKLRVEDVQGGVAIQVKPRAGYDLSTVRQHAQQIERRMGQSTNGTGATCELFTLGRSGATASVSDAQDGVRIVITASDPSQAQTIRKQARTFVNTAASKTGSGTHSGANNGANNGAGSPSGQGDQK